MEKDYEIKQEGTEAVWGDGAIRYNKDKGRYDLIPWDVVERLLELINKRPERYMTCSDLDIISAIRAQKVRAAIMMITARVYICKPDVPPVVTSEELRKALYKMLGDLAIHFQKGAEKYGERNCEKGIPLWSFLDSGYRHTMQYLQGMTDEPHHISAIWNFVMAEWTMNNHPEWCGEKKDDVNENTVGFADSDMMVGDEFIPWPDAEDIDEMRRSRDSRKSADVASTETGPENTNVEDAADSSVCTDESVDGSGKSNNDNYETPHVVIKLVKTRRGQSPIIGNDIHLVDFNLENATIIGSQKDIDAINTIKRKINERYGSINLKLADKDYINKQINKAIHKENETPSSETNKFEYMDTDLAARLHDIIRNLGYNVVVVRIPVCGNSEMTESMDIESNEAYIKRVATHRAPTSGRIEHFHVHTLYQKLMTHLMSISPKDYDDITTTCVINLMRFIEDMYFNKED